jgi:hypothetical protein
MEDELNFLENGRQPQFLFAAQKLWPKEERIIGIVGTGLWWFPRHDHKQRAPQSFFSPFPLV